MSDEKTFIAGMIYKAPHPNAPDFVKGSLSIKVSEFSAFAQQHQKEGWLNIDLKESKGGKLYAELNTFQKTHGESAKQGMAQVKKAAEPEPQGFDDMDIPF
jgi:hypothetical protein